MFMIVLKYEIIAQNYFFNTEFGSFQFFIPAFGSIFGGVLFFEFADDFRYSRRAGKP